MTSDASARPWRLEDSPDEDGWFILGGGTPWSINEHAVAVALRGYAEDVSVYENARLIVEAVNAFSELEPAYVAVLRSRARTAEDERDKAQAAHRSIAEQFHYIAPHFGAFERCDKAICKAAPPTPSVESDSE